MANKGHSLYPVNQCRLYLSCMPPDLYEGKVAGALEGVLRPSVPSYSALIPGCAGQSRFASDSCCTSERDLGMRAARPGVCLSSLGPFWVEGGRDLAQPLPSAATATWRKCSDPARGEAIPNSLRAICRSFLFPPSRGENFQVPSAKPCQAGPSHVMHGSLPETCLVERAINREHGA